MKYLFINSVYGVRSTGKIVAGQCHKLQSEGHECLAAYGRETIQDEAIQCVQIGTAWDYKIHGVCTRIFDLHGFCSRHATKAFLKKAEAYAPDVVWLHNLHGYYINVELLFAWLKRHPKIKVYWTLHDCWAFTGHCSHFTIAKCEQWKKECYKCSQLREYPKTYGLNHSKRNFEWKHNAFTGCPDLTLITPSKWLAELTRKSFLYEYPVKVVHNTIDREIFKPTKSNFREKNGLEDQFIILGVAVGWEKTKGLPDMLKLRESLDEKYAIVLVGITDSQKDMLSRGVLAIGRTKNQRELAAIYTAADVFVNPTHQDNYPTVNLEASACGTPVLTYRVGGSPESTTPENTFEENDIEGLKRRIIQLCENANVGY